VGTDKTVFRRIPNPAAGYQTNRTPIAEFTYTPTNPTSLKLLTLDASLSVDDQGAGAALGYRWDWESDRHFDTPFTNSAVVSHLYFNPGIQRVTPQIRDQYGALSTTSGTSR
jgi:hypothetical protein